MSTHGDPRPGGRSHPDYDPELASLAAAGSVDGHSMRRQDIARLRELTSQWRPSWDDLKRGGAVWPERRRVPGRGDAPPVPVLIQWPTAPSSVPRPVLVSCHGGGLVTGDEFSASPGLGGWVQRLGLVTVSVGYRLAPDHPYPAPLDDVLAVFDWLHERADELAIDRTRIGVFGISAGACLATAACLALRQEQRPMPAYQVLQDAMLDDRHERPSTHEHPEGGPWDRVSSLTSWLAYLPGQAGREGVPVTAAPGRAADDPPLLRGLPPAFLDIGTADLFRDDVIAYAAALAQAGVSTELHLWPGGWHGFSEMAAHTRLARQANETRERFIARQLDL